MEELSLGQKTSEELQVRPEDFTFTENIIEILNKIERGITNEENNIDVANPSWFERNKDKIRKMVLVVVMSLGSLVAVGCNKEKDDKAVNSTTAPQAQQNNDDWLDKTSKKMDAEMDKMTQDHEEVRKIAESKGIHINPGDKIEYHKVKGVIVDITVNGINMPSTQNSSAPKIKTNPNLPKSETKTNPDTGDFMGN